MRCVQDEMWTLYFKHERTGNSDATAGAGETDGVSRFFYSMLLFYSSDAIKRSQSSKITFAKESFCFVFYFHVLDLFFPSWSFDSGMVF